MVDVGELRRRPRRRCAPTGRRRARARWSCAPGSAAGAGGAAARAKASRTTRSTPYAVLMLTSVAISCGRAARGRRRRCRRTGPRCPRGRRRSRCRPVRAPASGRGHARVELGRAQVDVVVEREAQPQQQPALEDAAGHARVADGAEQDRVVAAQLVEHRVGQGLAGRVPAPGAEVVLGGLELDVVGRVTASRTRTPSATTSGPMPSPGTSSEPEVGPVQSGAGTLSGRSLRRCRAGPWLPGRPAGRACFCCADVRLPRCVRVIVVLLECGRRVGGPAPDSATGSRPC